MANMGPPLGEQLFNNELVFSHIYKHLTSSDKAAFRQVSKLCQKSVDACIRRLELNGSASGSWQDVPTAWQVKELSIYDSRDEQSITDEELALGLLELPDSAASGVTKLTICDTVASAAASLAIAMRMPALRTLKIYSSICPGILCGLPRLLELSSLDLYCTQQTGHWHCLLKCSALRSLDLHFEENEPPGQLVPILPQLVRLTRLDFSCNNHPLSETLLASLSALTNLQEFSSCSAVSHPQALLYCLQSWTQLTELSLGYSVRLDAGVTRSLAELHNLELLTCGSLDMGQAPLQLLKFRLLDIYKSIPVAQLPLLQLPKLETVNHLTLAVKSGDEAESSLLAAFAQSGTKLLGCCKVIGIVSQQHANAGLSAAAAAAAAADGRLLSSEGAVRILRALQSALTSLEEMCLKHVAGSMEVFRAVARGFPGLTALSLEFCSLPLGCLQPLVHMTKLQRLSVFHCTGLNMNSCSAFLAAVICSRQAAAAGINVYSRYNHHHSNNQSNTNNNPIISGNNGHMNSSSGNVQLGGSSSRAVVAVAEQPEPLRVVLRANQGIDHEDVQPLEDLLTALQQEGEQWVELRVVL